MAIKRPSISPHIGHAPASPSEPSSRCISCNTQQKENTRNLIVCIDGTSNQFGQNNTNVVKLHAKINLESKNQEQHSYYSSGIGTHPESIYSFSSIKRAVSERLEMAVAWNIDEIVKDAYGWLARMYQEGDQIYLFGFSRGAYQARVLAGMIHEVGLLRTPTEKQVGMAYAHYEAIRSKNVKRQQIAREFKDTFSRTGVGAHFVEDTVSSVGLIRGDIFLSCAAHACHFRHALALDERRVKFMPEYLHKMNSSTQLANDENPASPTNDRWEGKQQPSDIKEVWFPGSHSDVGGVDRPGKTHQAGNASLLWMRREVAAKGLVLHPTDIVWVPDDLDFGTSNSMTGAWPVIEYMPIKHQICFSGAGEDALRLHRLQPRRIIPGQKIHASVLYANVYTPQATLGEGFDIPTLYSGLEDIELNDQILWETELFDDTAALELVACLGSKRSVPPIYLDRLLFMLRFKEGKKSVRKIPKWQDQFMTLIHNGNSAPLVRLVAIVAFYEASCDPEVRPMSPAEISQDIFNDAREFLCHILAAYKHPDGPRVAALLRPLTKHQILRERILTQDVLATFILSLDVNVRQPGWNFGQVMDGLDGLLQCGHEDTRKTLIKDLGAKAPSSNVSRLSRILEVNDPHLQITALRMVSTLARIPEARTVCKVAKPRIRELASKAEQRISYLALDILLALYDLNDRGRLNCRDPLVRANIASALVRLEHERRHSGEDPAQQTLRRIFGLDAELDEQKKEIFGELKKFVEKGNAWERTAATKTLLKLCEFTTIRTYLLEINLLDIFLNLLPRKDGALLAAHALATCLKLSGMKEAIKDNEDLPERIVGMLRQNYFDDVVGQVEGFQIFADLMQHDDLRNKVLHRYTITEALYTKLGSGEPRDIRTSLVCLRIFQSYCPNAPWTLQLVEKSMEHLRNPVWEVQRAAATVLAALARTKHGVKVIMGRIHEIVEMLLPKGYLLMQPSPPHRATSGSPASSSEGQTQPAATTSQATVALSLTSPDALPMPPSWMLGPACALHILVQDKKLRDHVRDTIQYQSLKHLYLSGTLVDETDTSPWQVKTPNRADVTNMLDNIIKVVDEELSEEGCMSPRDMLPHIEHWDRLAMLIPEQAVGVITTFPARVSRFVKWLRPHNQDSILDGL